MTKKTNVFLVILFFNPIFFIINKLQVKNKWILPHENGAFYYFFQINISFLFIITYKLLLK